MKPRKGDIKTNLLIQGEELEALQQIAGYFTECFGLDDRIYNYKGKRPLGLYSWDFESLMTGIDCALDDKRPINDLSPTDRQKLEELFIRIRSVCADVHPYLMSAYPPRP